MNKSRFVLWAGASYWLGNTVYIFGANELKSSKQKNWDVCREGVVYILRTSSNKSSPSS